MNADAASPRAQPARFDQLPTELEEMIFKKLSQLGKPSDLLNSGLVCKDWRQISIPILWAHIYITNENISRFVETLETSGQRGGSLVRSLTVHMRPMPRRNMRELPVPSSPGLESRAVSRVQVLKQLHARLPNLAPSHRNTLTVENLMLLLLTVRLTDVVRLHLAQLRSCSWRINRLPDHPYKQWSDTSLKAPIILPSKILELLLTALPESCRSLELIDSGYNNLIGPSRSHIYSALRRITPRLSHLHLCANSVCPCFFNPKAYPQEYGPPGTTTTPFQNMKVMHIRTATWILYVLNFQNQPFVAQLCQPTHPVYLDPSSDTTSFREKLAQLGDNTARLMRGGIDRGYLPKIEELTMCLSIASDRTEDPKEYTSLTYSIVDQKVSLSKILTLSVDRPAPVNDPWTNEPASLSWFDWIHGNANIYCGEKGQVVFCLPGNGTKYRNRRWRTSLSNVRYPFVTPSHTYLHFDALEARYQPLITTKDQLYRIIDHAFPGVREQYPAYFKSLFCLIAHYQGPGHFAISSIPGLAARHLVDQGA